MVLGFWSACTLTQRHAFSDDRVILQEVGEGSAFQKCKTTFALGPFYPHSIQRCVGFASPHTHIAPIGAKSRGASAPSVIEIYTTVFSALPTRYNGTFHNSTVFCSIFSRHSSVFKQLSRDIRILLRDFYRYNTSFRELFYTDEATICVLVQDNHRHHKMLQNMFCRMFLGRQKLFLWIISDVIVSIFNLFDEEMSCADLPPGFGPLLTNPVSEAAGGGPSVK